MFLSANYPWLALHKTCDYVGCLSENYALVHKELNIGFVDASGKKRIALQYDYLMTALQLFKKTDSLASSKSLTQVTYDYAKSFKKMARLQQVSFVIACLSYTPCTVNTNRLLPP